MANGNSPIPRPGEAIAGDDRRAEWHRYYSAKRAVQQCRQLELLEGLDVRRVLEVGPYLGFVTALLDNAGYGVTTLDVSPRQFVHPDVDHIQADLTALESGRIAGFDAIVCCETLEHLWRHDAAKVLETFHASGAKHLVISVPYAGPQFSFSVYFNGFALRKSTALKLRNRFRPFEPEADPMGHKWEVGYRDCSLRSYERQIRDAGWTIMKRSFTNTTRSVFHLCERG